MKVAIVMPYYNEAELLRKSFEGILQQTYKNWHLFLVDDGSDPGRRVSDVITIPPEFTSKVIPIYKPNGGVSSARNHAIAMIVSRSTGEYYDAVAYCDSDDIWKPDYLEQQVKALLLLSEAFKEFHMVYAGPDHRFIDGTKAFPYGIPDYPEYPDLDGLLRGNCIFVSGVIHRTECLRVGFFDPDLNSIEDWDYWVRIAAAGYKISKNPYASFIYTVKYDGNGSRSSKDVYGKFKEKHADLLKNVKVEY